MEESGPRGSAGHCRANLTPRVSLTLGGSLETTGLRVATTDLDSWEGQAGGGESISVRGLECAPDSPGILHISDKRTQRAKNMRMVLSVQGAGQQGCTRRSGRGWTVPSPQPSPRAPQIPPGNRTHAPPRQTLSALLFQRHSLRAEGWIQCTGRSPQEIKGNIWEILK